MVRLAFAQEVEQPPDPSGSAGATPQPENARASWPRIGRCFPPKQRKLATAAPSSPPKRPRQVRPRRVGCSTRKGARSRRVVRLRRRRPAVIAIACVIAVFLVGGGAYYWYSGRNIESTDGAYTDGRAITIAPQVSGTVVSLDVTDNEFVHKGQPLIHIDPRQYKNDRELAAGTLTTAKAQHAGQQFAAQSARKSFPAQLEQAKAQVANAEAGLLQAQVEYKR